MTGATIRDEAWARWLDESGFRPYFTAHRAFEAGYTASGEAAEERYRPLLEAAREAIRWADSYDDCPLCGQGLAIVGSPDSVHAKDCRLKGLAVAIEQLDAPGAA